MKRIFSILLTSTACVSQAQSPSVKFEQLRPEVACDMKGQSGTAIKTLSKVIYEVLPAEGKRSFMDVEMGAIPDQVAYFSCYVASASVKW